LRPFASGRPSWSVVRNDVDHGYLDVKVEDGTLTAQALTPSGKLLDSFTLTKELPPLQAGTPAPSPSTGGSQPGSPSQEPVATSPGASNPPGTDPADFAPDAAGGCSAGPMAALLPAGALLLVGALRRRRQRQAR
jgi:uncharacterized protein (TIGR03382 family)